MVLRRSFSLVIPVEKFRQDVHGIEHGDRHDEDRDHRTHDVDRDCPTRAAPIVKMTATIATIIGETTNTSLPEEPNINRK
jgi:hypothetical protein